MTRTPPWQAGPNLNDTCSTTSIDASAFSVASVLMLASRQPVATGSVGASLSASDDARSDAAGSDERDDSLGAAAFRLELQETRVTAMITGIAQAVHRRGA